MSTASCPSATTQSASDEHRALIALSLIPGVGAGRVQALVAHLGSAQAALQARPRLLRQVPGIGRAVAEAIASHDVEDQVERQVREAERTGARLIPRWDVRFPELLRQIPDPPVFLWVLGDPQRLSDPSIAIVGTRRASAYGRDQARDWAHRLVAEGFTVVSGLASGIDAAAHTATIHAGGTTVAVLGTGVDRVYPAAHRSLSEDIGRTGALVSEYALGTPPDAPNFPRRNRIISGLSLGTLVVEAFERGGALITARLAVEQNREVFALPGDPRRPSCEGTNRLIQRGHAKLVLTLADLLEELTAWFPGVSNPTPAPPEQPTYPAGLSSEERVLLNTLDTTPLALHELCLQTGQAASDLLVRLLSLEMQGLVGQEPGQRFFRASSQRHRRSPVNGS